MSRSSATFSVIGADVTITGNVSASSELHVDGKIDGDIACASLVQGESSVINGGISAEAARMAGTVKGSIVARDLVILQTAHIYGDVQYDTLTIEQGAAVDGKFSQGASSGGTARGSARSSGQQMPDTDSLIITS